ncbi:MULTISPECIES: hypothetical protein [Asticcacaulis]|uniref:hypothetical protein n=1 Tax=Asticcacaulis TaxID=76890 RepID=UPI001AE4B00F|nr:MULTISPECIES: hypothetical protein [Asticcacaulis]MBP2158779.1 hypothetical protein [Asticcacaulis solisilvae]MDR6799825.1 hypothetical protein [Asticcacaulis sp. BE141]
MHIVTQENYEEATDAIRDIFMMYHDMTGYSGFGHSNTVYLRFDPLRFIDAQSDEKAFYVDMDLLRTGSAIAFLSHLFDTWLGGEITFASKAQRQALEAGRLAAFPDIEAVAREALTRGHMPLEDGWFDEALQPIYRKYVLAFFKDLSECDRPRLPSPHS